MEEEQEQPAAAPPAKAQNIRVLIDRFPSWAYLAGFLAFIAILALVSWLNAFGDAVERYLWRPIVLDSGYNPFNTVLLMVVLAFIFAWLYRLLAEWKQEVDFELSLGVIPYLVWGSMFRVMEDSDLFAPFNEDLASQGLAAGRSCAPELGGAFVENCLGVLFITPIIYVWITFVAVFFLWVGRRARRVSETAGRTQGLTFVALSFLGLLLLYAAWWASSPGYVRFLPNPLVILLGGLIAWVIVWRTTPRSGHVRPSWVMFSASLIFFVWGAYYIVSWMAGGRADWGPSGPVRWWILVGMVAVPTLLAWGLARKAQALARAPTESAIPVRTLERPNRLFGLLCTVLVLEALVVFASLVAIESARAAEVRGFLILLAILGPALVLLVTWWFRRFSAQQLGVHPAMMWFALPINVIMFWGQVVDAVTSSLGIDVLGYHPKQVVPRTLRGVIERLNLPAPFSGFPTTLGLIPAKVLLVLGIIWIIDVARNPEEPRQENLIGLVKLAIIMVGLSPGVRDGVRLAMGT